MSFKLNAKCVRKTESLDGDNTYAELTLQPENMGMVTPITDTAPTPPTFGLMNAVTFTIRDATESANYKVGETYEIAINATVTSTATKSDTSK